jgi:hypothetical protein
VKTAKEIRCISCKKQVGAPKPALVLENLTPVRCATPTHAATKLSPSCCWTSRPLTV